MKSVEVDAGLLKDAAQNQSTPFDGYFYNDDEVQQLVADLQGPNPTCYMVTGYRGTGKSSLINRIYNSTDKQSVLFVTSNFSRYDDRKSLLRKLFRDLYLEVDKSETISKKLGDNILKDLELRYDQTFEDIRIVKTNSRSWLKEREAVIDVTNLINISLTIVLPFIIATLPLVFFSGGESWKQYSLSAAAAVAGFAGAFSYTRRKKKTKEKRRETTRESMYDDEIVDYHFHQILGRIREAGVNLVFVLDELDKVEHSKLQLLLKDMKPFFVSGDANFIAVAGQRLFYQYYMSQSDEDALLASLFTKFIHIRLMPTRSMLEMGYTLCKQEQDKEVEQGLENYLIQKIFRAKRVTRSFIGQLRREITWENDKAYLQYTEAETADLYADIISVLEILESDEILVERAEGALKDFYTMQIYRASQWLTEHNQWVTAAELADHISGSNASNGNEQNGNSQRDTQSAFFEFQKHKIVPFLEKLLIELDVFGLAETGIDPAGGDVYRLASKYELPDLTPTYESDADLLIDFVSLVNTMKWVVHILNPEMAPDQATVKARDYIPWYNHEIQLFEGRVQLGIPENDATYKLFDSIAVLMTNPEEAERAQAQITADLPDLTALKKYVLQYFCIKQLQTYVDEGIEDVTRSDTSKRTAGLGYDFINDSANEWETKWVVDFKYRKGDFISELNEMLSKGKNILRSFDYNAVYLCVVFAKKHEITGDSYEERFQSIVEKDSSDLVDRIKLIVVQLDQLEAFGQQLEEVRNSMKPDPQAGQKPLERDDKEFTRMVFFKEGFVLPRNEQLYRSVFDLSGAEQGTIAFHFLLPEKKVLLKKPRDISIFSFGTQKDPTGNRNFSVYLVRSTVNSSKHPSTAHYSLQVFSGDDNTNLLNEQFQMSDEDYGKPHHFMLTWNHNEQRYQLVIDGKKQMAYTMSPDQWPKEQNAILLDDPYNPGFTQVLSFKRLMVSPQELDDKWIANELKYAT